MERSLKRRFHHRVLANSRALRAVAATLLALQCAVGLAQTSATWNTLGPPGGSVSSLLTDPTAPATLYAGTPENGVFLSTDAGTTWAQANGGLAASTPGRQTLYTVYTLVTDGRYVFAATAAGLFYRSAGASASTAWTALASTGSSTPIAFLAFEPLNKRLFAASNSTDGLSSPGVYSTTLDTTASVPAPVWSFHALPVPASASPVGGIGVVAQAVGSASAGLFVSVGNAVYSAPILAADQTLNWVNADPTGMLASSTVNAVSYNADFQQTYACSGGAVYNSGNALDALPVWTLVSVPAPSGVSFNCNSFASVPTSLGGAPQIALGTDQGALASLDGTNFLATASIGPGASANAFAVATAAGAMTSSVFVGSGFGVSAEAVPAFVGGANWVASNGPASVTAGGSNARLNNANVVDSAVLGSNLYAAAVSNQYVEVLASADGGASWNVTHIGSVLNPFEDILSLAPDAAHGMLFAGTTQGLLVYSTASAQWGAVTAFNFGQASALALGTSAAFVGTDDGLKALPLGAAPASAMPVAAGLSGMAVKAILVTGGTVYAGVFDAVGNSVVYSASESTVAAGTAVWTPFGTGNLGTRSITGLVLVGGNLLASTTGNLVLYASAQGAWASANTSATPSQRISDTFGIVNALYTDGTSIYAATGSNGIFVSPVGTSFTWTALNGSGDTALPTIEVHSLRANASTLYASTRAGVAAYAGLTPVVVPPVVTPPSSSGSGGGGFDIRFGMLLLATIWALKRTPAPGRVRRS